MPTYEYRCQSCRRRSSRLFRSFSQVTNVPCPHCGSDNVTRLPSTFAIHKSWDSGPNLPSYESMSDFDEDDPASMAQWTEGMGQDMGDDFGGDLDDYGDDFDD